MKQFAFFLIVLTGLAGCAETTVTPLSANSFLLTTSGDEFCGTQGVMRVASRMAAVETLRRGQDRYVIQSVGHDNSIRTQYHAPVSRGFVLGADGLAHPVARNPFDIGYSTTTGSNDTTLTVTVLTKSDPGYSQGLDARQVLGPDWESHVRNGVVDC
ncbi:hypothetical protein [Paracoccus hibiscisoli]|uniref:Uncharacterized protein n=1 Tax=Paracoccus hibiscisoli TaxID=2023261 RepID=A0A4U0QM44_9RHOB|nr:hypothetical protein [Paracoccus hibiscisoli]TJZ82766.1 hypothetical protein FA740_14230 [Paracoccus hibiscisoli]